MCCRGDVPLRVFSGGGLMSQCWPGTDPSGDAMRLQQMRHARARVCALSRHLARSGNFESTRIRDFPMITRTYNISTHQTYIGTFGESFALRILSYSNRTSSNVLFSVMEYTSRKPSPCLYMRCKTRNLIRFVAQKGVQKAS